MSDNTPSIRRALGRLTPHYSLRTMLVAVLLVAVLLPVGLVGWRKYVLYRDRGQYDALQATKEHFVQKAAKEISPLGLPELKSASFAVDSSRPIPDDFVVLLRKGDVFGCFIPRKQHQKGESLEYDWYYRTDGKGRFDTGEASIRSGHTVSPAYISGSGELVHIQFGPFDVKWSGNGPGWGFLYHANADAPIADLVAICTTPRKALKDLNARDAEWIYTAFVGDSGLPGNVKRDAGKAREAVEKAKAE